MYEILEMAASHHLFRVDDTYDSSSTFGSYVGANNRRQFASNWVCNWRCGCDQVLQGTTETATGAVYRRSRFRGRQRPSGIGVRGSIRPCWLNRDPIGTNGGINLYGYVGNNPIDFVDPLGLWQVTIGGGWGIAGEISFGYNSGRANISGTIGVGGGLAGSFNPNDSGPSNMQGPSTTEGLVAKGDLDLGFVSLNGEAGVTTESDGCHHFHDKAYLVGGANLNAVEPGYPPFGGWSGEIGVQQSGTDNGGIQSRGTYAQSNGVNYSAGVLALAGAKVGVSW
jgi:hypothetical protein